jgi:ABC-type uncharacterized transport system auxiliary subunit
MHKKLFSKIGLLVVLTFLILVNNCSQSTIQRQYYLLDYPGVVRDSSMVMLVPFPVKVMVQTLKLPRTYDRTNIVVRYSAHQIDYYRYRYWAIKPQIMISDLIARQLQSYRLFLKCEREFLDENPDYEIIGYINAFEKFHNEAFIAAHLSITLYLRRSDDFTLLIKHEFERQEQLYQDDMAYFAKKMSDILREEVVIFTHKMIKYFKTHEIQTDENTEN